MTRHSKTSSFGTTPRIGHDSPTYYESRLNRELAQETSKAEADQPFPDALRNRIIAAGAAEMKDLPDRCLHI